MPNAYFPGNVVRMTARFRNKDSGNLEDPAYVTLYVYSHTDDERTEITMGDLTNSSTGVWSYDYIIPIDSQRDRICYGFYGIDSGSNPYAYSENIIRVKRTCADPYT